MTSRTPLQGQEKGRDGMGSDGIERKKEKEGIGEGEEEEGEWDRPPTSFGLRVAQRRSHTLCFN